MPRASDKRNGELLDLASHAAPYVTVNELSRYWLISRKQIYKQIEKGNLPAIRFGPRSLRIRTKDAFQFERRSSLELPHSES
jgi:excisionase family DNA binding protein